MRSVRRGNAMSSFYAILAEDCQHWDALASRWRISGTDADAIWIEVHPHNLTSTPRQGWKLHISAGVPWAEAILHRALSVLLASDAAFKIVATRELLIQLNLGHDGLSQIGKFITVYPNDDAQAVRLAVALDLATRGLRGPAIPSDRPLAGGSLVHYRYGSFRAHYIQPAGRLPASAISTPDGQWVEDVRTTRFLQPEWASDPFERAGVAAPLPAPHPLIGGRYLVMGCVQESARGGVYWGVDLDRARRVILKRGARDAAIGSDGRDARSRLRHEAIALHRFAPDPRFPTPGALIEHEDDLYLAMEDMPGATFQKHVADRYRQGLTIPSEQIAVWGRELASLLDVVHTRGFIYSDLKSSNIIVSPSGRLRLLDFDHAAYVAEQARVRGGATRGYASPDRALRATADIADDIYGLGALLYFAATGADPLDAARPGNLLERPISLLNPAIGSGFIRVIERCLTPDPAARFLTLAELDAALAALDGDTSVHACGLRAEDVPGIDQGRCIEIVRQLGDRLSAHARRRVRGEMPDAHSTAEHDLYAGSAGILFALAAVAAALEDNAARSAAAELAHWLRALPRPAIAPPAGLYIGEAGRALALLRAGQALRDAKLIEAAAERGRWVVNRELDSPDLMCGAAGRLRSHLWLWAETREEAQWRGAIAAGDFLLDTALHTENGACWQIPPQFEAMGAKIYLGYAHGAAGIGDALLDLYSATGATRFLRAAQDAATWLTNLAAPALDDGSGLNWPSEVGLVPTHVFWCHGAAGIGKFFLHAAQLGVIPDALSIAARAARTVARGSRWAGPSQCHGLAGNIEFLLDMFEVTHDPEHMAASALLTRLLITQIADSNAMVDWSDEATELSSPDYMLGYGGVAATLARLCGAGQMPRQSFLHESAVAGGNQLALPN